MHKKEHDLPVAQELDNQRSDIDSMLDLAAARVAANKLVTGSALYKDEEAILKLHEAVLELQLAQLKSAEKYGTNYGLEGFESTSETVKNIQEHMQHIREADTKTRKSWRNLIAHGFFNWSHSEKETDDIDRIFKAAYIRSKK